MCRSTFLKELVSEASNLNTRPVTLLRWFRCLIECRDEYKYNVEAVELLIRNHLVNMQQYDLHLAQVHSTPAWKTAADCCVV